MNRLKSVLRVTLKSALYLIIAVVMLLSIVILLLNVPAVQKKVLSATISWLHNKTKAEISLEKVGVSLNGVSLNHLLIKDLQHDTLLSAEELDVRIDLTALINKKIIIRKVILEDAVGRISRRENDSTYNFNFLIEVFASHKPKDNADTIKDPIHLSADKVELKNIRFTFDDQNTGIYFTTHFQKMDLETDVLDVNELIFGTKSLAIEQLSGKVIIRKEPVRDSSPAQIKTTPKLPYISSQDLKITNSNFSFIDYTNGQSVVNVIGQLSVKNSTVDLNKEHIENKGVYIGQSEVRVNIPMHKADSLAEEIIPSGKVNWIIHSDEIVMENNNIRYNVINVPESSSGFDANHINYEKVSLRVRNGMYSNDTIKGHVVSITTRDPYSPNIQEFSTFFTMTQNFIKADKLIAKTKTSTVSTDAMISFASLESIADSLKNLNVYANVRNAKVYLPELLYFAPALSKIELFNQKAAVSLTGKISGRLSDLNAKNLVLSVNETRLATNAKIKGLPEIDRSTFDVPDLLLTTTTKDIHTFAGKMIPGSIVVPDDITLSASFNGRLKSFVSTLTLQSSFGHINASTSIDKEENFQADIVTNGFNVGALLKDTKTFGPVSIKASVAGKGLDTSNMTVAVKADASSFYLNQYTYHHLNVDASYSHQKINGKISLKDEAADFDLEGFVNLNKGQEAYQTTLQLRGADLKKLNLHKDDIRIALTAVSDIKGSDMNTINGTAGITQIIISSNGKKYVLDSLLFAAINEEGNSELNVKSAIVGVNYKGTFAPGDLIKELKNNIGTHFSLTNLDTNAKPRKGPQNFKFDIELHNHPVINEVFLSNLKEFEPGKISGSYTSENKKLDLLVEVNKLNYNEIQVNNLRFNAGSDESKLDYQLRSDQIITSAVKLDNLEVNGRLANQVATTRITSTNEKGEKKLSFATFVSALENEYKISVDTNEFIVMNHGWEVSPQNYILISRGGFVVNDFRFSNTVSELSVYSSQNVPNSDIHARIKNFKLDEISRVLEKDTTLLKGNLNGEFILRKIDKSYGIIADVKAEELVVRDISVGNIYLAAENTSAETFSLDLTIRGSGNEVKAKGQLNPANDKNQMNLTAELSPITAKTFEAFSFGQIRDAEGVLSGNFKINGTFKEPEVNGSLTFQNVVMTPALMNSPIRLNNETVKIEPEGIQFSSFTILDKNEHPAIINGTVTMKKFKDLKFSLEANTSDFLLLNTSAKDNEQYYGKMIVDSRIRIRGDLDAPTISSSVKLKNGSNFTFAVTETELTTDKGEGVILFTDSNKFHPILIKGQERQKQKSTLRNYDISSTIEIDNRATIRLMLDPGSQDSLVVRGDAALSFAIDRSGKISLTGTYNLSDGSYVVSLENLVKKNFKIESGSTITWNGDPLDADIKINAIYSIRTSPIDLVAAEIPETEKAVYRQRYPFMVYLKLRGAILTPQISFEIQLPTDQKGILGGTINSRLEQLNENPSALNKQVFALLVLNRFIQENPLQSESDGGTNVARTTVGKFLSQQLNQLSSKFIPGVDVNFDVQSYDDYSTGTKEGRTEVGVGVSKQLFNDRVSVQVGGSVDVEGEKAKQNTATDITGDVIVEYKLTRDGRYRIKGFRFNQYAGVLEGQIIETGAGILYVRDFEKWKQLFLPEKKDTGNNVYYDRKTIK